MVAQPRRELAAKDDAIAALQRSAVASTRQQEGAAAQAAQVASDGEPPIAQLRREIEALQRQLADALTKVRAPD